MNLKFEIGQAKIQTFVDRLLNLHSTLIYSTSYNREKKHHLFMATYAMHKLISVQDQSLIVT